jgi:hypothetical protein
MLLRSCGYSPDPENRTFTYAVQQVLMFVLLG